ncbi:MAG: hypothetical protein SVV80_04465 [Planctomycetota bacterium]|nr:hypothetical protein [Planctomycetota bacterium]
MGILYPLWTCPTSAGEDDVVYYFPLRTMVAGQVRSGQLPLWNAGEAGGVALLADPQSAVFFPPNWMFLFLPPRLAYSLCIFLTFALAGGGAYLYMRRIGLILPAAIFGAVAFEFCGFMVGHRVHLGLIQTAAFLPWGLWCIERLRKNAHRLKTCATGIALMAPIFALTLAAGHWPTAINLIVVWFVYLLIRCRPVGRALAVSASAAVIGSAILAPQIIATASYIHQTVRSGVPYVVAGENSFFPLAGVLAFFPFIMGNRTPNFFSQQWWGPWHLCEMLGYVGLVTLTLAAGTIWKFYRKSNSSPDVADSSVRFVHLWTWILIGAAVWALGYYLPTYRLIHMIPIFGSVRCPARMLLVIDLALAVLAAIGIDALVRKPASDLGGIFRRSVTRFLPACMFGALLVLALVEICEGRLFSIGQFLTIPSGAEPFDIIAAALSPFSPAVYVPLVLAAVTVVVLCWFIRLPSRRAWVLTVLVIVDLFFIVRFVDVPAVGRPCPNPQRSPAVEWLNENAPTGRPYRLWGLSKSYHHRPSELLLPKTCAAMGFESISYYGPFQPAEHPLLFGFRSWGENYEWAWLIRRNHLISLYNVRYILAADPEFRRVIESVRIPKEPLPPDGPDLLSEKWVESKNVTVHAGAAQTKPAGRVLVFRAPSFYLSACLAQDVALEAGKVYRIALDARAPKGAGNCITAEYQDGCSDDPARLRVDIERLTSRWRRFEWTFRIPAGAVASKGTFRIETYGDLPIEVRNVSLRRSSWPVPINLGGRLKSGDAVYIDRTPAGLPPINSGDHRVHIYENLLCLPRRFPVAEAIFFDDNEHIIETLRWEAEKFDLTKQALVTPHGWPRGESFFVSGNWEVFESLSGRKHTCRRANGLGVVTPSGELHQKVRFAHAYISGIFPVQGLALAIYLLVVFILPRRVNRLVRRAV